MMKKLLVVLLSALMVLSAGTVMAGGGHHYKHHGYGGHHKSHGYYKHRGHNSHNGAYLVGGLLLGSLITQSYNQHQHAYRPTNRVVYHSSYREPVIHRQIVYRTRVIEPALPVINGRHLIRDLEGNCFEIHRNDEGDELKEQLPQEDCHW